MNKGARLGFIIGGSIVIVFSAIILWGDPFLSTLGEHKGLGETFMYIALLGGIIGLVIGVHGKKLDIEGKGK